MSCCSVQPIKGMKYLYDRVLFSKNDSYAGIGILLSIQFLFWHSILLSISLFRYTVTRGKIFFHAASLLPESSSHSLKQEAEDHARTRTWRRQQNDDFPPPCSPDTSVHAFNLNELLNIDPTIIEHEILTTASRQIPQANPTSMTTLPPTLHRQNYARLNWCISWILLVVHSTHMNRLFAC